MAATYEITAAMVLIVPIRLLELDFQVVLGGVLL